MSDIASAGQSQDNAAEPSSRSAAELSPSLRASAQFLIFSLILLGILLTVAVDVLVGIVVLSAGAWAWRGFKVGLIKSGTIIVSLLAICAWAIPLGKAMTPQLRTWCNWPFVPVRHLSILLVALGILAAGYLLGTLLNARYLTRRGSLSRQARLLGMGAGVVEGVLLSIMSFSALLAIETPTRIGLSMIMDDNAAAHGLYDQCVLFRSVANSTFLGKKLADYSQDSRDVLEMGGSLAIISRYEGAIDNLKNHPFVVQLLADNTAARRITREIKHDRALRVAVESGDMRAMLNSSTVTRLLDDALLAREVQRYQEELIGAVMNSVPFEFREEAGAELAKLHGMSAETFLAYAAKKMAALNEEMRARRELQSDAVQDPRRNANQSIN